MTRFFAFEWGAIVLRDTIPEVMTMRIACCTLLLGALLGAGPAVADTLIVDTLGAAQASAAERPARGMSMARVEARWGAPASRAPAVGQPPITRWDYPAFAVFFEYDHVVHAVATTR
jgi:hypothetical protein